MLCRKCESENVNTFTSEIAIHFPGLDSLKKPIVWAFPKLQVCLRCGFTDLTIPERELRVLRKNNAVKGAVVLRDRTGSTRPWSKKEAA